MKWWRTAAIFLFVLAVPFALSVPSVTVEYPPLGATVWTNTTAYVFASSNETGNATIRFIKPVNMIDSMVWNGGMWVYSITPSEIGYYIYNITVTTAGGTNSTTSYFISRPENTTLINVEVLPSCRLYISDPDIPSKAKMNKDYVVTTYIKNLGNIHVNEKPIAYVKDKYNNPAGVFIVGTEYKAECAGNETRLEQYETFVNGTDLSITSFQCYWRAAVPEFGTYTYIVDVNYSSVNSSTNSIDYGFLNATRNCTSTYPQVNCTKTFQSCRFDVVGSSEQVSLTTISSVTVPDQDFNYSAYEGQHGGYTVYSYKLVDCDSYCYVCRSLDTNLTTEECAREGGIITDSGYKVYSISYDGQTVDLRKVEQRCENVDINYTCLVESGIANCNVTAHCYGISRKEKSFKIPEPAKLVIIREKPEHMFQYPGCSLNSANSTNGSKCNTVHVKTILFNRGEGLATNITFNDTMQFRCSFNCTPMSFKCSSEYNLTCNYTLSDSGMNLSVTIPEMSPKEYVILDYYLVPHPDPRHYAVLTNHYFLNGSVTFFLPIENRTVLTEEDDEDLNPSQSKRIYFVNDSFFDYDLDVDISNGVRVPRMAALCNRPSRRPNSRSTVSARSL